MNVRPAHLGVLTALVFGCIVWVPVVIGLRDPIDLLVPGAWSPGGPGMVEEFGDRVPEDYGYDGQTQYVIARELPDLDEMVAAVGTEPRYRIQRILLPLLASPATTGTVLIASLHVWSLLGIALAAAALAVFASQVGRPPAATLVATAPLLLGLMLTTTEPLATGLVLVGLLAATRDRIWAATGAFALAGLARESYLLAAVATAGVLAWQRRWRDAAIVAVGSVGPTLAWWLYLRSEIGGVEDTTGPLSGALRYGPAIRVDSVLAVVAAVGLCAAGAWRWRRVQPILAITCALFLLSVLAFGSVNPIAILRVPAPAICLAVLALLPPLDEATPAESVTA